MAGTSAERQEWLEQAVGALRTLFAEKGYDVPANVRVAFGWPSSRAGGRIGECWGSASSTDEHNEIFISPSLGVPAKADLSQRVTYSARILDVLAHEIVHAVVGVDAGHKSPFKRCAVAIGLTGKMTATVATPEFNAWAFKVIDEIGTFPAGGLVAGMGGGRKKQTTRLLKCECPACGYVARVTNKWICDAGAPICPADNQELEVAA